MTNLNVYARCGLCPGSGVGSEGEAPVQHGGCQDPLPADIEKRERKIRRGAAQAGCVSDPPLHAARKKMRGKTKMCVGGSRTCSPPPHKKKVQVHKNILRWSGGWRGGLLNAGEEAGELVSYIIDIYRNY